MTAEKMVYNIDEAAEQLGIGRTFAYQLIREHRLPSIKLGNRRLIAKADLEVFIENLRHEQAA